MHTNEDHIKLVNGLVETTIDSADGYEAAAKEADGARFKDLFEQRAQERRTIAVELQREVRRLGGEPKDDGTILAAAHRVFLNLKDAVTKGDQAVVDEVEAGEDHIKAKYEKALQDTDVDVQTRAAIEKAWTSVKSGHDQMRDIKHMLKH
ncbi:PA2169 family four-helix-bundle protein [Caulobacter segnis]|uniref:PA2169 family four-helix-bundle protein n=1 Tax=Caulobacter segnis TaxID=88688 RepID=UPI0024101338|nr:PA2169 family four-helix-bundle protein [Caulobacter segnis]MDG2520678.1 PA2169 family four-helix-bundle protein [Caulobacter segnis]